MQDGGGGKLQVGKRSERSQFDHQPGSIGTSIENNCEGGSAEVEQSRRERPQSQRPHSERLTSVLIAPRRRVVAAATAGTRVVVKG